MGGSSFFVARYHLFDFKEKPKGKPKGHESCLLSVECPNRAGLTCATFGGFICELPIGCKTVHLGTTSHLCWNSK